MLGCVMLVDDDSYCNMINRFVLERNKAAETVISHTNALDALLHLDEIVMGNALDRFPNVILLDLCMSQMDGWEFLEKFKEYPQPYKDKTSVYILTSSIMASDRERAEKNLLVSGYIEKPFTQFELERIISLRNELKVFNKLDTSTSNTCNKSTGSRHKATL